MPYITREDGEHFVIPSYRDVLTAKQKSVLKKDILLLSQSYGEYITLQRKSPTAYEVAFSPDTGHLLGESIWHYFKRPPDMIYCEAIPSTNEAILVIVRSGSVYLDGSFPLDTIPEELVIFLTQQTNFEIYIYGDVPISETEQEGKFSFEPGAIRSFTELDQPIFPQLPLYKMYQLQLVDPVLKAHGIGVFPIKQILSGMVVIGLLWMVQTAPVEVNPYQAYISALNTPAPDQEMKAVLEGITLLLSVPGWQITDIQYSKGILSAEMQSQGSKTEELFAWAAGNNAEVKIQQDGIYLNLPIKLPNRAAPTFIYPLKQVIGVMVDRLANVYPGNRINLSENSNQGMYQQTNITINIDRSSPVTLSLIGEQMKDLPLNLQSITLRFDNRGNLTGSILLQALGN
jgi:hypothetical protein